MLPGFPLEKNSHSRTAGHPLTMERCPQCRLQNLALLDGPSFLAMLDLQIHKRIREYGPNTLLFSQGEESDRVLFVEAGRVIIRYITEEFELVTARIAHAGDVLGLADVWHHGHYTTTGTTNTAARVGEISAYDLLKVISRHEDLRRDIEKCLTTAHDGSAAPAAMAWLSTVAAAVLKAYDTKRVSTLAVSMSAVSAELQGQRPRAVRQLAHALSILEERGIVIVNTPSVVIINPNALRTTAQEKESR